jgi:hypothetical protein
MDFIQILSKEQEIKQDQQSKILSAKKGKKKQQQYKRNLKRVQRAYFVDVVEKKKYYDDNFLDQVYDWYFIDNKI